jgi:hypothetical protein
MVLGEITVGSAQGSLTLGRKWCGQLRSTARFASWGRKVSLDWRPALRYLEQNHEDIPDTLCPQSDHVSGTTMDNGGTIGIS